MGLGLSIIPLFTIARATRGLGALRYGFWGAEICECSF